MAHSPETHSFENEGVDQTIGTGETGSGMTIHVIAQFHLDNAWYWTWDESLDMLRDTLEKLVTQLDANPDARFAFSQIMLLDTAKKCFPSTFERLADFIREGRIEPVGGVWVESDHNLPSGEALARQFLTGQRFLKNHFGKTSRVAWSPDAFGHPDTLPQIFRESGIDFFVFKRPLQQFMDLPNTPFIWEGLDGTRIPCLRANNKGIGLPSISQGTRVPGGVSNVDHSLTLWKHAGFDHAWGASGTGDTGGVPQLNTPDMPGVSTQFSTPTDFYVHAIENREDLPVVTGEFNPIFEGCYTTHAEMKSGNRAAERALLRSEFMDCWSASAGKSGAKHTIDAAWKELLALQFHDILPGTGSPETHASASGRLTRILEKTAEWDQHGLDAILSDEPGDRFVIFNATPHDRTDSVIVTAGNLPPLDGFELVDHDGNAVPLQVLSTWFRQSYRFQTVAFVAKDVPGFGYRAYKLRPRSSADQPLPMFLNETTVGTDMLHCRFQRSGANLAHLAGECTHGANLLSGELHWVFHETGNYAQLYGEEHRAWSLGLTGRTRRAREIGYPEVIVDGPVLAKVRTRHALDGTTIEQVFSIWRHVPRVDVDVSIDFQATEQLLRLEIPTAIPMDSPDAAFRRSVPFGWKTTPADGRSFPAIDGVAIGNDEKTLAVFLDGRQGVSADGNRIRIDAARCATFPDRISDRGLTTFRYALMPVAASFENARIPRHADAFRQPLTGYVVRRKPIKDSDKLLTMTLSGGDAISTSLKRSESGNAVILRLLETAGKKTDVSIRPGRISTDRIFITDIPEIRRSPASKDITLQPNEIRTIGFSI